MKIEFEISDYSANALEAIRVAFMKDQKKDYKDLNDLSHDVVMQFIENQIIPSLERLEKMEVK